MANWRHTHLGRGGLKTIFIVIFVDCTLTTTDNLSIWKGGESGPSVFDIKLIRPSSWWNAAGEGCGQNGGHLYFPQTDNTVPPEVTRRLVINTGYWVGAVQNSVWKWTSDGSPVYKHVGYSNVPRNQANVIQGNSVFSCHLRCVQNDKRVFGLRGDECYCLSETDIAVSPIPDVQSIVRCAGNYEEHCGGDTVMSVYKLDTITLTPKANGQCAYAVKYKRNVLKFFQYHNCNSKRSMACHKPIVKPTRCRGNVCTQRKPKTWEDAMDYCRLLKVTNANVNFLYNSITRLNPSTYWVGLRREYSWRWINGSSVLADYDNMDNLDTCLAVIRPRGSPDRVKFVWMPCRNKFQSICQTAGTTTTQPTTSTTKQTTAGRTEAGGTSSAHTGAFNETTTALDPRTAGVTGIDYTGGYVGAAIGCIVAVGIIVAVVVIMQRKKKFCFAGKFNSAKASTKFNTMAHNNDDPYYSTPTSPDVAAIPTARVKPNIHVVQNVIKDNTRSNTHNVADDNYYSTPETSDDAAVSTAVVKPNNHKHEPLYVNSPMLSKETEYNTFMDTDTKASSNHAYNHVCVGKDVQRQTGTYDHASPTGVCSPLSEVDQRRVNNNTDTHPAVYCELLNEPEYHIAGSPQRTRHGEGMVYDEARPGHPVSHPVLYSLASQLQNPSARSEGSGGPNRIYSVLDNSAMDENIYRHIGDNDTKPTGELYEVANDINDHPPSVSTVSGIDSGSQMYSLAGQTGTSSAQTVQQTGLDTDYLLQGNVCERDTGIDNFYSLANDTSTV